MKTLGKILAFILCFAVGASAVTALTWSVLYVAVPSIADSTDKLFGWNDYADVEDKTEDNEEDTALLPNPTAVFENENIKITLG